MSVPARIPPGAATARMLRLTALLLLAAAAVTLPAAERNPEYAAWIEQMKTAPRGPFERIRWFCKDGTVLPPTTYACKEHGGGSQHGEWNERTRKLRAAGYRIANFYSDLDIDALLTSAWHHEDLAQMVIEQFFIRVDDGWILRQARFYRGAFQEEGERAGARRLLFRLAEQRDWLTRRFLQLRTSAALLRHGAETSTAHGVRQAASAISERDAGFVPLRNKIHAQPAAGDAARVREYATRVAEQSLARELAELAAAIEELYTADHTVAVAALSRRIADLDAGSASRLMEQAQRIAPDRPAPERFAASARLLAELRDLVTVPNGPALRMDLVDTGHLVESEHFTAAIEMRERVPRLTRRERLDLLGSSALALYGAGLLSRRQLDALEDSLARLVRTDPALPLYREELNYLGLVPAWATQHLRFFFGTAADKLAEIEPMAHLFVQDQLRGSPMFFYALLVDELVRDGNRQARVSNRFFGADAGAALRALNPGLARGVLHNGRGLRAGDFRRDGIYLLPETEADLPPVAGIITAGEGNPISHVQLLARNLGIPNVAVSDELLQQLVAHAGSSVVLAVSEGGAVLLENDRGQLDALLTQRDGKDAYLIQPDLDKLDLAFRDIVDLARLRADDSGRIVGPKAAKLGELKHFYPDAVADGLAVPFGVFRSVLEQPSPDGDSSMFEWLVREYRRIARLPRDGAARERETEVLRRTVFDWISDTQLDDTFRAALEERLHDKFGADGGYGVFVRSDTNVEDLPGFTGAGLNLTLPNVVGSGNIMTAIPQVWASPFTARAFAWRQALMPEPEHVYPAVLLLESVNVEKSGVLVTRGLENGDPGWLSVAVNEGVGGAVDGQSAESLRIHRHTGEVKLLAQASAPVRRQVDPQGGIARLPASGADHVLRGNEIRRLVELADSLPERFPPITDAAGQAAPADIEFGFQQGQLRLFQIRPFLDSAAAKNNAYLRSMDPDPAEFAGKIVDLEAIPEP